MSRRRGASTALSLAVLVLVIVFGVVGLLVSHTAVSSAQAEAMKVAEMAAEAGREKLTAYIWKNVTATGNITMLTLENRGDIGLSIDRAMAVGYDGGILSERDLSGSPVSLGAGEHKTMRLDAIFPGYAMYEGVKKNVKNVLFKTLRGNVFGSTYSAPERFEAYYGATVTGNGTTVTLTHSSGETFTAMGDITITTITSGVTLAQGVPRWDAEIYVAIALTNSEYAMLEGSNYYGKDYMTFPTDWYKAPDWLILPELKASGRGTGYIPRHVSCMMLRYAPNYNQWLTGYWDGIGGIDPGPTWAVGERISYSYLCNNYHFPVYKNGRFLCWTKSAAVSSDLGQTCWREYFYPYTSIPEGEVTIKAPAEIVFAQYVSSPDDPYSYDTEHYILTYFTLQYYIFYDAWNMSRVLLSGSNTQDTLYVDRPIKGGFVYVYSRTEVKMPPPPPRSKEYTIWLPNICMSDDTGLIVASVKGDEGTRTVTVDFDGCTTCDAYVAPGPGVYAPSEVSKCPKSGGTASCHVPEGSTVILDANPKE